MQGRWRPPGKYILRSLQSVYAKISRLCQSAHRRGEHAENVKDCLYEILYGSQGNYQKPCNYNGFGYGEKILVFSKAGCLIRLYVPNCYASLTGNIWPISCRIPHEN